MKTFVNGLKSEFTKIVWPEAAEAFGHAVLVIGIALLVGYYLGLLDAIFAAGLKALIG
jgi:preprotein translocase SecE subunit